MGNSYQLWHILQEKEMLKNARIFEIGPPLDISVCVQSFTIQHTYVVVVDLFAT